MKKLITYLLYAALLGSIQGCSNSSSPAPKPEITSDNMSDNLDDPISSGGADTDGENLPYLGLPAINENNYQALLVQALEVYFGTAFDQRLPSNHGQRLKMGFPTAERETSEGSASTLYKTYACSNGGTVEHRSVIGISPAISFGYEATNCQYNNDLISGSFDLAGYRETSHDPISVQNYTVSFGSEDSITASGQYRRYNFFFGYNSSPYDWTQHWTAKALNYEVNYLGTNLSINDITTTAWYGYAGRQPENDQFLWRYQAQLEGSFTMQTPLAANITADVNATINVSTLTPLSQDYVTSTVAPSDYVQPYETPPLPRFNRGTMRLEADDGSSVTLQTNIEPTISPSAIVSNGVFSQTYSIAWDSLDKAMILRDINLEFPASLSN